MGKRRNQRNAGRAEKEAVCSGSSEGVEANSVEWIERGNGEEEERKREEFIDGRGEEGSNPEQSGE